MNALRKLSTGERVTIALAALVIATAVAELITGAGLKARIVTFLVLALIIGCHFTLRLIGTGGGAHAAPRGFTRDDDWPAPGAERVLTVPRAAVMSTPPWEPVPPDAYVLAAATVSDGQVTSMRVGVLPALPAPPVRPALPAYVTDEIGDRTVDDWLESAYTRAMAREVAEMESRDG